MEISVSLCRILSKKLIAKGTYDFLVEYSGASAVKPGQFANIKCNGFTLRRPISICEIDRKKGRLRFVFEIRGAGTEFLAGFLEGGSIDILAPLGNGFNLGDTNRRAVFVGGGTGVPPLLEAAKPFRGNADVILGFRSYDRIILEEDFKRNGNNVTVITDDGSQGVKGSIAAPLVHRLETCDCDVIFACGPRQMLTAVAHEAQKRQIPCFVSMEERMACGVGACLSCACKVNFEGKEQYHHVCKNGPVFDAKRIIW